MLYLSNHIVQYPLLKSRLLRFTWIPGLLISIPLFLIYPALGIHFVYGIGLGYLYLLSLFMSTEAPKRRLAGVLSVTRMAAFSFFIAFMGQFKPLETCVVFCGFLSYKLVLVLETVRFTVGIKLNRGK